MKYVLIFLSILVLLNSKETNEDLTITFFDIDNRDISDENGVLTSNSYFDDTNDLFDSKDIDEQT